MRRKVSRANVSQLLAMLAEKA